MLNPLSVNLCNAAWSGNLPQVQELLASCGATDVAGVNERGQPALYCASHQGFLDIVIELLNFPYSQACLNLRIPSHGGTALHAASFQQQSQVVIALLVGGANTKVLNSSGLTARQEAKGPSVDAFRDFETLSIRKLTKKYPFLAQIKNPHPAYFFIYEEYSGSKSSIPYAPTTPVLDLIKTQCEWIVFDFANFFDSSKNPVALTPSTVMKDLPDQELFVVVDQISDVIKEPLKLEQLKRYGKEVMITESIEFVEAIHQFKEQVRMKINEIWEKFNPEGDSPINVPHSIALAIEKAISCPATCNSSVFDSAEHHVNQYVIFNPSIIFLT